MHSWTVPDYRAHLRALVAEAAGSAVATAPLDRHAVGRRLAHDVAARDDLPRFDSSAMDGFAVAGPGPQFVVVAEVAAGGVWTGRLGNGQAVRIMTGARVPEGATCVVPVEVTDAAATGPAPAAIRVDTSSEGVVEPGRHIRRAGEDVRAGQVIARRGALVTPALIALGRSAGIASVDLTEPLRVAVIATGAELTDAGVDPGAGGIHESNSDMVAAQATAAGCEVRSLQVCDDEPDHLRTILDDLVAGGGIGLVITTGGVSMGAHEVVRQVLEPLPGMAFGHVRMQPGAPQGHGRYRGLPVVCLPGTPVGAFVGFEMLLRPALDAAQHSPARPIRVATWSGLPRRARAGRVQFVTAVEAEDGTVSASNSRHLAALAEATCLVEIAAETTDLAAGDEVLVHPL